MFKNVHFMNMTILTENMFILWNTFTWKLRYFSQNSLVIKRKISTYTVEAFHRMQFLEECMLL